MSKVLFGCKFEQNYQEKKVINVFLVLWFAFCKWCDKGFDCSDIKKQQLGLAYLLLQSTI